MVVIGREATLYGRSASASFTPANPAWWRRAIGLVPANSHSDPSPIDLKSHALRHGVDVLECSDPSVVGVRARIRAAEPDAFVVAGFHRLLPKSVLELAARGGLNVHPGRLPEERGPAPVFWRLKAGHTTGYVTLHLLDAGEDTGALVDQSTFDIVPGMSGREVLERAATAAAPKLVACMGALLAGTLCTSPQPSEAAARCPRPTMKDCRVDASRRASEVFTYVAACADAYPVFVECGGDRFFIESAISYDEDAPLAFEYLLSGDRLMLRCEPGVVELALKPGGALFTAEYIEETDGEPAHQEG